MSGVVDCVDMIDYNSYEWYAFADIIREKNKKIKYYYNKDKLETVICNEFWDFCDYMTKEYFNHYNDIKKQIKQIKRKLTKIMVQLEKEHINNIDKRTFLKAISKDLDNYKKIIQGLKLNIQRQLTFFILKNNIDVRKHSFRELAEVIIDQVDFNVYITGYNREDPGLKHYNLFYEDYYEMHKYDIRYIQKIPKRLDYIKEEILTNIASINFNNWEIPINKVDDNYIDYDCLFFKYGYVFDGVDIIDYNYIDYDCLFFKYGYVFDCVDMIDYNAYAYNNKTHLVFTTWDDYLAFTTWDDYKTTFDILTNYYLKWIKDIIEQIDNLINNGCTYPYVKYCGYLLKVVIKYVQNQLKDWIIKNKSKPGDISNDFLGFMVGEGMIDCGCDDVNGYRVYVKKNRYINITVIEKFIKKTEEFIKKNDEKGLKEYIRIINRNNINIFSMDDDADFYNYFPIYPEDNPEDNDWLDITNYDYDKDINDVFLIRYPV